ncbi:MAG: DUF2512 family protein [Eubacteriales bacterium]
MITKGDITIKHLSAIIIKFLLTAIVLEIILTLTTQLGFTQILIISVSVTLLAYLIGDLLILPVTNNIIATIADIGLSLVVILLFNYRNDFETIEFSDALICAVVIGVCEWFFHKYVSAKVFYKKQIKS